MAGGNGIGRWVLFLFLSVAISVVLAVMAVMAIHGGRAPAMVAAVHEGLPHAGLAGIKVVSEVVPVEGSRSASATCPEGSLAVGGGAQIEGAGNNAFLTAMGPLLSDAGEPVGWQARSQARIAQTGKYTVTIYALCALPE